MLQRAVDLTRLVRVMVRCGCVGHPSDQVVKVKAQDGGSGSGSRAALLFVSSALSSFFICVFCALFVICLSPPRLRVASRVCLRVTARLCTLWELNELLFRFSFTSFVALKVSDVFSSSSAYVFLPLWCWMSPR